MIVSCKNCKAKLPVPDVVFKHSIPKITCPQCKISFKPELAKEKEKQKTELIGKSKYLPIAWLIVHDEKAVVQTFEIKSGKYTVGRKSDSRPCDIMIETGDMTMSRNHFTIEAVEKDGFLTCWLSDKNSSNNTYINSNSIKDKKTELKNAEEFFLGDGDVIQAGQTKIVFKRKSDNVTNSTAATQIITKMSYAKTVLI